MPFEKTVAAISTPPGKGGVAVIRISGDDALKIAERIFIPRGAARPKDKPRYQIYGDVTYRGEIIDDGLLTYFPAPGSYTGEDVVEISCHGGVLISATVLESAFLEGAYPAEAGEFTKRAFVSGKLSLTETEAIGMLLEAQSQAQIRLSRPASRSTLARAIEGIRTSLTSLLSSIYARIDYPEEDLGEFTDGEVTEALSDIISSLDSLISTYRTGRAVSEGINTVICGKPNVGKSTLYNLICGDDAAIVTDIPGTTRDVLERRVAVGSIMLNLFDTAGIREGAADAVEAIGIERSRERISSSELILALFDCSRPLDGEDERVLEYIKDSSAAALAIITKCDLPHSENEVKGRVAEVLPPEGIIEISARCDGIGAREALREKVEQLFTDEKIKIGDDAIISSARQHAALLRAKESLALALDSFVAGIPSDAAASDIELALGAIAELDGRAVSEEVVSDIFSKFCVGK